MREMQEDSGDGLYKVMQWCWRIFCALLIIGAVVWIFLLCGCVSARHQIGRSAGQKAGWAIVEGKPMDDGLVLGVLMGLEEARAKAEFRKKFEEDWIKRKRR